MPLCGQAGMRGWLKVGEKVGPVALRKAAPVQRAKGWHETPWLDAAPARRDTPHPYGPVLLSQTIGSENLTHFYSHPRNALRDRTQGFPEATPPTCCGPARTAHPRFG